MRRTLLSDYHKEGKKSKRNAGRRFWASGIKIQETESEGASPKATPQTATRLGTTRCSPAGESQTRAISFYKSAGWVIVRRGVSPPPPHLSGGGKSDGQPTERLGEKTGGPKTAVLRGSTAGNINEKLVPRKRIEDWGIGGTLGVTGREK